MRNMLLIAKREYLEQIRGRAFRFSTIALPLLFAVVAGVQLRTWATRPATDKHIVIAGRTTRRWPTQFATQLLDDKDAQLRCGCRRSGHAASSALSLQQQVQAKAIDGCSCRSSTPIRRTPTATYTSLSPAISSTDGGLQRRTESRRCERAADRARA